MLRGPGMSQGDVSQGDVSQGDVLTGKRFSGYGDPDLDLRRPPLILELKLIDSFLSVFNPRPLPTLLFISPKKIEKFS